VAGSRRRRGGSDVCASPAGWILRRVVRLDHLLDRPVAAFRSTAGREPDQVRRVEIAQRAACRTDRAERRACGGTIGAGPASRHGSSFAHHLARHRGRHRRRIDPAVTRPTRGGRSIRCRRERIDASRVAPIVARPDGRSPAIGPVHLETDLGVETPACDATVFHDGLLHHLHDARRGANATLASIASILVADTAFTSAVHVVLAERTRAFGRPIAPPMPIGAVGLPSCVVPGAA
jgi:hypothetical protein